ncbi:hypothetical protein DBV15_05907 [Temnothorax longispinosus]|uniref:Uncharacterized protein n=1 Tax=Temnothorax longispinosus TaxID=300112 RepID=A0A4S2KIP7_9HYME|nr:hypothetical protein DBV15_05907 [Temnothorax longispinosus]
MIGACHPMSPKKEQPHRQHDHDSPVSSTDQRHCRTDQSVIYIDTAPSYVTNGHVTSPAPLVIDTPGSRCIFRERSTTTSHPPRSRRTRIDHFRPRSARRSSLTAPARVATRHGSRKVHRRFDSIRFDSSARFALAPIYTVSTRGDPNENAPESRVSLLGLPSASRSSNRAAQRLASIRLAGRSPYARYHPRCEIIQTAQDTRLSRLHNSPYDCFSEPNSDVGARKRRSLDALSVTTTVTSRNIPANFTLFHRRIPEARRARITRSRARERLTERRERSSVPSVVGARLSASGRLGLLKVGKRGSAARATSRG